MVQIDPEKFPGAVFDLDGVITDTASLHFRAWSETFDAFTAQCSDLTGESARPFSRDDYLRFVDGRLREDGVEQFLHSRGILLTPRIPDRRTGFEAEGPPFDSVEGIAAKKTELFLELLEREGPSTFPSSVELIVQMKSAGMRVSLATASKNCRAILGRANLSTLFDACVDGVEIERLGLAGKPDPASFLEAAKRIGIAPERAVVFEDAISGVTAGHRGRFGLVIGVSRSAKDIDLLEAGADTVVCDLAEVTVSPRPGQP